MIIVLCYQTTFITMNIRTILSTIIILVFSISTFAQKNNVEKTVTKPLPTGTANTACDCKDAIKINTTKATQYGLTKPSLGFGSIQEITSKSKGDKSAFEAEHNTAWYLLSINFDGEFVFEITPQDTTNDYDFLLYKYTDTSFCQGIQKNKIKPVRSNLSRLNSQNKGITGLASDAKSEFVGKGIGAAYSKSVKVLKGEKYMLVLDNVYPDGKGHVIHFNYVKQVSISGVILDADSVPVKSEISFTDNKGNLVKQVNTESDGKYTINTEMKEDLNYSLSFSSDSSFTSIKTINTKELKQTNSFTDVRTILLKLKKGMKYNMSSINFFGGEATLLPSSYLSIEALYKLMKKNKRMIIRIEGHINGSGHHPLSVSRAKTVYDYLQKQGIEKERMSFIGFGGEKQLYPNTRNETEASANRRVEINVISIK
ncbi:MAG: OmpA family protein [Bacteroidota bacterium]|nr:OmpA family protein [Bacteroidota bacterium]